MKNFLTSLIFFLLSCLVANAQQSHFIYLQTENKQPFFVKINNAVLNSYPLGYLIIPKLDDGLYSITVGFPETNYEQEFNCSINNKDLGFIIKSNAEKQWQLVNVQTHDVIIPGDVVTKKTVEYEKQTDPFSTMLANAVHDSTILRKSIVKNIVPDKPVEQNQKDSALVSTTVDTLANDSAKNDIVKDTAQKIISNTDVVISKQDQPTDSVKKNIVKEVTQEKNNESNQKDSVQNIVSNNDVAVTKPVKKKRSKKDNNFVQDSTISQNETVRKDNDVAFLRSDIKRKLKKNSKDGMEMLYVDNNTEAIDTIRILIPNDKKKKNEEIIAEPVVSVPAVQEENKQNETVSEKNRSYYKISSEERKIIKEANMEISRSPMINSDCKTLATDEDFLKIRKKMVAENNDEDMVKAAKKILKTRCFTTDQIKNLSTLFLKDEGKYSFYETAYPFVSDSDLYYTLEKQLSEEFYITRFKALVNK